MNDYRPFSADGRQNIVKQHDGGTVGSENGPTDQANIRKVVPISNISSTLAKIKRPGSAIDRKLSAKRHQSAYRKRLED